MNEYIYYTNGYELNFFGLGLVKYPEFNLQIIL